MKKKNILVIGLLLISAIILSSCKSMYVSFTGGPVEEEIRQEMTHRLKRYIKKQGYKGTISVGKAEHFGFSRGGIDAEFIYTEKVNGKKVSVSDWIETNDGGEIETDDVKYVIPDAIQKSSLQQPATKKYKKTLMNEFKAVAIKKMTFEDVEMNMDPDFSSEASVSWFKNKVAENRKSSDNQFDGYYKLPVDELLKRSIVTFRIDYTYHISKETEAATSKGHKILNEMVKKVKTREFPDGQYLIGFNIKSDDGDSGSISDMKYFLVKNGVIIKIGKYGDDQFIDDDASVLLN